MSQFQLEAFTIGVKEGLKLSLSVFVVLSYLRGAELDGLKKPLFAGILTVCAASAAVLTAPGGVEIRDGVVKLIGFSFGIFYLLSLGTLFHATGTDMIGPFDRLFRNPLVLIPVVYALSLLYYVPDMAGSSLYAADLFFMSGNRMIIFALAAFGLLLSVFACLFLARRWGASVPMTSLFSLPQVLLFLALMKLLTGGVRGFAELSLIPSVQAGLMKFIHDVIHQTFVMLMVPDHPILTTTTWNFIGIFFGETVSLWLALVILVLPLLLFINKHFSQETNVPEELHGRASQRLYIKSVRDTRLLKSLPVLAFLLIILGVWFVQKDESSASLYDPQPLPVAISDGMAVITLNAPGQDLLDGMLHKYSLSAKGQVYRLLVIKKPSGALAVCLDACEICKPDGYAQGREHVICIYCKTPIPFDTVGKPGGCNPIPVKALVTDKEIRIEVSEIEKMWMTVNTSKGQESGGK